MPLSTKTSPSQLPPTLKPFKFHNLDLHYREGADQALAECPFCRGENKFSINVGTGLWRCFVCNEGSEHGKVHKGGNVYTFIRKLWEESVKATREEDYEELANDRGLLSANTPRVWGAARSITSGDWILPGFAPANTGSAGTLNTLYRYYTDSVGKRFLLATSELQHQLFMPQGQEVQARDVYLTEGPWDGMALWEVLRSTREESDGYKLCGNPEASMLASSTVIAVPGANSFYEKWCTLLEGKRVFLLYDSDHPKQLENGRYIDGAGFGGVKRVAQLLSKAEQPPAEVFYLNWGDNGYDQSKKSGWDVRDALSCKGDGAVPSGNVSERIQALVGLLENLSPISPDWISDSGSEPGSVRLTPTPCYDWNTLVKSWHKALSFHEGLDRALSCMLAVITSTPMIDDQLWMKVVGPPSCGKSTLCEALNVAHKYVISKSMITGFHSGYKTDKLGEEDNSLMAKIGGMTLVTKDADSLLSGTMNTGKILSQARDLFDGETRTFYGNQMGREYVGLRMTWILCGTNALHALDSSELGARFLNCVIMEEMEGDTEADIAWRAVNRQARNVAFESNGEVDSHKDKDLTRAMQLTGGYVNYLRENGKQLARGIKTTESSLRMCAKLGLFISHLRARPSTRQEEKAERELCFRLSSQLTRLAMCLAIVLNKKELDGEVMRRTARVAMDTARGRTMEIVSLLYHSGEMGQTSKYIAMHCNKELKKKREMLHFLRQIGVVELYQPEFMGVDQEPRYRLSDKLRNLYGEVLEIVGVS